MAIVQLSMHSEKLDVEGLWPTGYSKNITKTAAYRYTTSMDIILQLTISVLSVTITLAQLLRSLRAIALPAIKAIKGLLGLIADGRTISPRSPADTWSKANRKNDPYRKNSEIQIVLVPLYTLVRLWREWLPSL